MDTDKAYSVFFENPSTFFRLLHRDLLGTELDNQIEFHVRLFYTNQGTLRYQTWIQNVANP